MEPKRGPTRPLTPEDLRDALAENNRDIVGHFTESFGSVHERFDRMDKRFDRVDQRLEAVEDRLGKVEVRVEAMMKMLAMREELHNLVRVLKQNGLKIDEAAVFVQ